LHSCIRAFVHLARLYPILDFDAAAGAGWRPLDLADAFLTGGATFSQLRAKTLSGGALFDVALALAGRTAAAGAALIVNDRADIAKLSGASGVHVGQTDLPPAAARLIVGPDAIVGVSTHSMDQVERALAAPVSYVAVGPVFATATKATGYAAIGLDGVRVAAERTRRANVPLVAIGGITRETAAAVLEAGAASVAVIADLLAGGNPAARVRSFLEALS
jgi:thiamine-phosphate pyrophosphorylase